MKYDTKVFYKILVCYVCSIIINCQKNIYMNVMLNWRTLQEYLTHVTQREIWRRVLNGVWNVKDTRHDRASSKTKNLEQNYIQFPSDPGEMTQFHCKAYKTTLERYFNSAFVTLDETCFHVSIVFPFGALDDKNASIIQP